MWTILERGDLHKTLGKAPLSVRERYEFWKNVVRFQGPGALRDIGGFKDETLKGKWKGYRSSRLSLQWRVIYRVEGQTCEIFVERVTPHEYRR